MNSHNLKSNKNPDQRLNLAGIHLSGAHSSKSSVVILAGSYKKLNLSIEQVHYAIGSTQHMSSDDRILSILSKDQPSEVFFDCPLSLPPCIQCILPSCPGQQKCSDISVNYMHYIYSKYLESKKNKKKNKKLFNPQHYRLWDLWWGFLSDQSVTPSFGSNMATITSRAQVLQKRMLACDIAVKPKETSPRIMIDLLRKRHAFVSGHSVQFSRNLREEMVLYILKSSPVLIETNSETVDLIASRYANFAAFLAAVVAVYYVDDSVFYPPKDYLANEGWVYLPKLLKQEIQSLVLQNPSFFEKYTKNII